MFGIFVGHREHRQNTQAIFMGCSWLLNWKKEGIFLSVDLFEGKTKQISIGTFI